MPLKVGILGAGGRMGRLIAQEVLSGHDIMLAAACEHPQSAALGDALGNTVISADKAAGFSACDLMIDFTVPAATAEHARLAQEHGCALVVGTTGLGAVEQAALEKAVKTVPVLQAANMSLGVNLLLSLVKQAARKLGTEYDVEIFEAHHRHKTDAPSGTALALGRAAATGRGVDFEDVKTLDRTGARKPGAIGFSVFRGGDVVGDHTVTFAGAGERIELAHKAGDRSLFAKGAVRAARWLHGKPPGLYSMGDVLGLEEA